MEYIFGTTKDGEEVLKTKGAAHSDLTGCCQVINHYPDRTVTDSFFVSKKTGGSEDAEGNCYDWYEIKNHNRSSDSFDPCKEDIRNSITDTQDALCESTTDISERLSEIEDALCEMSEGGI